MKTRLMGVCMAALAITLVLGACGKKQAQQSDTKTEEVASTPSPMAGTYSCDVPAADTPGRKVTMMLHTDQTAMMTTDYMNDQPAVMKMGKWAVATGDYLDVTFEPAAGDTTPPVTMHFMASGDTLMLTNSAEAGMGSMELKLIKQPGMAHEGD
jgi:NlpE N-terminal domain